MGLGILYPNWFFFFQCYAVLDIASHWLHLTASHYSGKAVTCLIIEYHVISLAINTWLLVKYHDVVSCVKKRILFSNNNINTSRSALQIVACPNSQRYIQEGFWEKYPLMWSIAPTPPPNTLLPIITTPNTTPLSSLRVPFQVPRHTNRLISLLTRYSTITTKIGVFSFPCVLVSVLTAQLLRVVYNVYVQVYPWDTSPIYTFTLRGRSHITWSLFVCF